MGKSELLPTPEKRKGPGCHRGPFLVHGALPVNSKLPARPRSVKWLYELQRRGRVRIKQTVKVACHRPVPLEGGGEDLVRCGTALVTIIGFRPRWVGFVYKIITVSGRAHKYEYHVTQPYTDKAKCRAACENSIKAGQTFEANLSQVDEETRRRWERAAFSVRS